eukprot:scaffold5552_cov52-Phaeocystis_antarctica.AAC.2
MWRWPARGASTHWLERAGRVARRGSARPWQASLGPASGASHHVWSPQWAVSRLTSTTAGHSDSCESASAVSMRVQFGDVA